MKILDIFVLLLPSVLPFVLPLPASAAPDPLCVGASQVASLDYSNGAGRMCFPMFLADGSIIAETKIITCIITFFDGAATPAQIGSETFTGEPGSLHPFSVPRDGTGTSVAVCTLDTLVSATRTVTTTFPVGFIPNPPIILP